MNETVSGDSIIIGTSLCDQAMDFYVRDGGISFEQYADGGQSISVAFYETWVQPANPSNFTPSEPCDSAFTGTLSYVGAP